MDYKSVGELSTSESFSHFSYGKNQNCQYSDRLIVFQLKQKGGRHLYKTIHS
jgi:hypothetical protein